EWLPDNRSAILVSDFRDASVLAEYVTLLNANDDEYDRYLAFKRRGDGVVDNAKLAAAMRARRWGVRDEDSASPRGNFVEHFECHVCERLHEGAPARRVASAEHYGCPRPGRLVPDADASDTMWQSMYDQSRVEARAWRRLVERNVVYSSQEYYDLVSDMAVEASAVIVAIVLSL
ncbi:PREDICTED: alpha-(1,3)-fucosyltransferase 10-like, partial [Priapulus caudatus]|uniref:Fucosyltransferase n=1 Tax=Priapulus caudatus TaxID=37621 RepID=A0ABM1F7V1_PRICU